MIHHTALKTVTTREIRALNSTALSTNCDYYGSSEERNLHKLKLLSRTPSGTQLPAHQFKPLQPFPSANRDPSQGATVTHPFDSIASNHITVHSRHCSTLKLVGAGKARFLLQPRHDWKPRNPLTAGRSCFPPRVSLGHSILMVPH